MTTTPEEFNKEFSENRGSYIYLRLLGEVFLVQDFDAENNCAKSIATCFGALLARQRPRRTYHGLAPCWRASLHVQHG